MLTRIFTILLVLAICHATPTTKRSRKSEVQSEGIPIFDATSFDYDYIYNVESRASKRQKASPTTTEGPLMRYWNSFVRSVRLPIPSISWNMTNPLTNMFNVGAPNILETPVSNYSSQKRRRKSSKKHKNSTKSKKRKRYQDDGEEVAEQDLDIYEPITKKPQVVLQPYPEGMSLNNAMYFYDPHSHQFYGVQRLHNTYNTQSNYYPTGIHHEYEKQQSDREEGGENEVTEEQHSQVETSTAIPVKKTSNVPNKNEDVAVVETLDDEDDRKATREKTKSEESLRNAIGSYMKDDNFNRRRQQAVHSQGAEKKRVKQTPKGNFKYFFLNL